MIKEEILNLLAEQVFEISVDELNFESNLDEIETWDSMASLILISVLEEEFSITNLDGLKINEFNKISDIVQFVIENQN